MDISANALDYQRRANQYAPQTLEEMRTSAHQLIASGLTDHDVATALRLDVNYLSRVIGHCAGCGE